METKEKILETAARSFAKRGFEGTRIDALAKEAGVNKATLYYHFKSKQEIFEAVLARNFLALQKEIDDKLFSCATPEEKIAGFVDVMFARERRDVLLIIREIIDGGDNLSEEIIMLISAIKARLHEILKDGKRQGVFGNDDPSSVMYLIVGVSDFYIMSEPFRRRWKEFQHTKSLSPIDMDEKEFIEKIKSVIMNFVKEEGR